MKFFLAKGEFKDHNVYSLSLSQNKWISEDKDIAIYAYQKHGFKSYTEDTDCVFFGIITSLDLNCNRVAQLIHKKIIEPKEYEIVGNLEVREESYESSIDESNCRGCINADGELGQFLNMKEYIRLVRSASRFMWNYIIENSKSKAELLDIAKQSNYSSVLVKELHRIDTSNNESSHYFIPAHYIIEGNNPNIYGAAVDTLIKSLDKRGRLFSRQVNFFDVDAADKSESYGGAINVPDKIIPLLNDAFADVLQFNTVVIKYGAFDTDATYSTEAYEIFNRLIDLVSDRADTIQAIFVIPEGARDLANRIKKRLSKPVVHICPDEAPKANTLTHKRALSIVKGYAKEDGIASDSVMDSMLLQYMSNKSFTDLREFYNDWKMLTLAKEHFPQYLADVKQALESKQVESCKSAREQLEEMIGLVSVKEQLRQIIARFKMNKELERKGLPVQKFAMHLAFTGAPGTGKTEVARLYAEILKEEGILDEGRLIVRSGGSGFNVREAFKEAKGSVLFVDEAYGMTGTLTSITEFIALMENNRNDTVVILAGYEGAIDNLLSCNPGFKSRLGFIIHFPDYSASEKLDIFKLMAKRAQMTLDDYAISELRSIFERGGSPNDEGNGRFVRKLFEDAIGVQQLRLAKNKPTRGYTKSMLLELKQSDIEKAASKQEYTDTGREVLSGLVGLKEIKDVINARLDFMRVQKIKRDLDMQAPFIPMHMVFNGNPGTGKTEIARLVGRILKEEGVLSVGECFELLGNDFLKDPKDIEAYVTGVFEKAKGSVIFIDEAYTLAQYEIGVASLIAAMENYREEVVVILAGYKDEMCELLKANPGFESRIKTKVHFPDYTVDELVEILQYMADKSGAILDKGVTDKVREILKKASKQKNFGNARFVRNLLENALLAQGVRLANGVADLNELASVASADSDKDTQSAKRQFATLCADDFTAAEEDGTSAQSAFNKDFGGQEIGFCKAS